jgi:dTDP-4-dehydrorhamnose reductase
VRIALTGVSGQIGAHLAPRLRAQGHEVVALTRADCDLSQPAAITAALEKAQPELVINPAAYTAVDKAETERDLAFAVNEHAPHAMAQFCRARNVPLIHFSTDYVFDGENTRPWREADETRPVSTYGASKLAGEQAVLSTKCAAIILRTSWVYSRMGRNFLLTMQKLASERDALRVVADQHGTPNSAQALADAVAHMVSSGIENMKSHASTYHLTTRGATTWHGFASAIVAAGTRQVQVHAITTAEFPTPAKRPAYSVLDGGKFEATFNYAMPTWEDALADCLRTPPPT